MMRPVLLCLAMLAFVAPAYAQERTVAVEGVAPASGDPARARRMAIGDALRQAIAAGGMDLEARTFVDRNVVRADSLWATAKARVTGYRLTDEWREAGLLHVSISATIAPLDAPSCSTDPLPRLHLGMARLDVDPALDPATVTPMLAMFDHAVRLAFGADPSDPLAGPASQPVAVPMAGSADRYAALAYGNTPGTGIYIRPYVRLGRRVVPGPALVKGQRMDAVLGLELIDAARGNVLGRVEQDADWTLAARGWEYLPADYRPPRRHVALDIRGMTGRLIEDARQLMRCRPVAVAIAGRQGDELLLGGGSEAGLKVGDLLGVGGPTVQVSESPDWPLAEVVAVNGGNARARLFNPGNGAFGGQVAVRLR